MKGENSETNPSRSTEPLGGAANGKERRVWTTPMISQLKLSATRSIASTTFGPHEYHSSGTTNVIVST